MSGISFLLPKTIERTNKRVLWDKKNHSSTTTPMAMNRKNLTIYIIYILILDDGTKCLLLAKGFFFI